jgi:Zn finger protein HypA/HybF involved in hydrogenase expression
MRAVLIFMFVGASNVFAGEEEAFACRHCGLKGTHISGNLMTAEQRVAFCGNKDHFVSISWDYHNRPPKPMRPDGKTPVFACPICKTPTARQWDKTTCPRCGSKHFKIRSTGMAVD